jgi:hypothetical protein
MSTEESGEGVSAQEKDAPEKIEAAKAEVQRLLHVGFIREVRYPQWQARRKHHIFLI